MAAAENAQRRLDELEATGSVYEQELVNGPSDERIEQLQAAVDAMDGTLRAPLNHCALSFSTRSCTRMHVHTHASRTRTLHTPHTA